LADLIANIQITFTFYQQILDYNNMELYESYPTFTTTCYDDSHEIIYTPTFSYIDSNLFGINVPSIFQASGFYGFSDPAASAYIANILMVS
jgi:hypothetical protein